MSRPLSFALAATLLLSLGTARAEPPRFQLEGNALVLPSPIVFEAGGEKLAPQSEGVLAHVKAYFEAKSYISLMRVEAHTDSTGEAAQNQALSERRALAVARALIARGVDCKRLIAVGFGADKPVAANDSPEGKAKNRRVEFINAELRGRPIGGMPVDGGGAVAGALCP